jgi:hypothetical protein
MRVLFIILKIYINYLRFQGVWFFPVSPLFGSCYSTVSQNELRDRAVNTPASYVDRRPAILTEVFHGFPLSFQASAME